MTYLRFLAVLCLLTITSCSTPTIEKDGGITAVIEVSEIDFLKTKIRNPKNAEFKKALSEIQQNDEDGIDAFIETYTRNTNGKPCVGIFDYSNIEGLSYTSSNEDLSTVLKSEFDQGVALLQQVLLARLEKLDISSPSIERGGSTGLLYAAIPEVKDLEFIGKLLSKRADFGLYETYTLSEIGESWSRVLAIDRPIDTLTSDELLFEELDGDDSERKSELENKIHSFGGSSIGLVKSEDKDWVMKYLEKEQISAHFPSDLIFMLGNELEKYEVNGEDVEGFMLYAIRAPYGGRPAIGSEHIQEATTDYNKYEGMMVVGVSMTMEGANEWEKMTSENVGQVIAITLDQKVYSAPRVNGVITGGRTEISGSFTTEEAENLASMMNTGAIPVSFNVTELKLVAPSE